MAGADEPHSRPVHSGTEDLPNASDSSPYGSDFPNDATSGSSANPGTMLSHRSTLQSGPGNTINSLPGDTVRWESWSTLKGPEESQETMQIHPQPTPKKKKKKKKKAKELVPEVKDISGASLIWSTATDAKQVPVLARHSYPPLHFPKRFPAAMGADPGHDPTPKGGGGGFTDPKMVARNSVLCWQRRFCLGQPVRVELLFSPHVFILEMLRFFRGIKKRTKPLPAFVGAPLHGDNTS